MIASSTLILIVGLYFGALLFLAFYVERSADRHKAILENPWVYTLSLAVYCTSWTFYGSVGVAANHGLLFLTIYLGPTLAIFLWGFHLRKMISIKERHRITSIADFISLRYNRSAIIAALVSILALLGTVPYVALQIKAVTGSVALVMDVGDGNISQFWVGFGVTLMMVVFTILVGVRRLDPTERHQGMMVVLATESIIKLVAFIAVGLFVTYSLFNGFGDIVQRVEDRGLDYLFGLSTSKSPYLLWGSYLVLAAAAIQFLPRQFHVAVVENSDVDHIRTAIWGLPLYLFLINIFVWPIAAAGLLMGMAPGQGDGFVLSLPLNAGHSGLALLVFIGGISAAMAMIMVSTVTLSVMASNHLLLPLIEWFPSLHFMRRRLLQLRWVIVATLLMVAFAVVNSIGDSYMLVRMGMISFLAAMQFAPAIILGLYWRKASTFGAICGLSAGLLIWLFTQIVPALVKSGWLSDSILQEGLLGSALLRPEALFGMTAMGSIPHTLFWSLFLNILFLIAGSLYAQNRGEARRLAEDFVDSSEIAEIDEVTADYGREVLLAPYVESARKLLSEYFSLSIADKKIEHIVKNVACESEKVSVVQLVAFTNAVKEVLNGILGAALAHKLVSNTLVYKEHDESLIRDYFADVVSRLDLTPQELVTQITRLEEQEKDIRQHAQDLTLSYEGQHLLTEIMSLAFSTRSIQIVLSDALESLLAASWLSVEAKGAIFIFHRDKQQLEMMASINLAPEIESACSTVQVGHCLCGICVAENRLIFKEAVDDEHHTCFEGMHDHGHYVIPIPSSEGVLGVIVLYLEAGHEENNKEIDFLVSAAQSISAIILRKQAEEELHEVQLRMQGVMDNATAIIYLKDCDGTYRLANKTYQDFLGLTEKDMVAKRDEDLFSLESAAQFRANDLQVIETGNPFVFEERVVLGGVEMHFLSTKFPLKDTDGNVVAIGGISTDISERKAIERALKDARTNLEEKVADRTRDLELTNAEIVKEKNEQQILIKQLEDAQNQLLQSEKLASIGQLAAGVAHEINNPIGYVNANLNTLNEYVIDLLSIVDGASEELSGNEEAKQVLEQLIKDNDYEYLRDDVRDLITESSGGIDRVKQIVQDLKDFSRVGSVKFENTDIKKGIESTINVVWNELKYKTEVVRDYSDVPLIECVISQLNQVVMNLLVNAAQAIKEKGVITIRLYPVGDDRVGIDIEDTGAGMDDDTMKKVFDPFFTTKPVGKGTGLGLSLSFGIVERHHGKIDVSSTPGVGTCFKITLPVRQPEYEDDTDQSISG